MDQFEGIPLLDGDGHTGGAILYLQVPARKGLTYRHSSGWKAEVLRGCRTLVLTGVGGSDLDDVLQQSLDLRYVSTYGKSRARWPEPWATQKNGMLSGGLSTDNPVIRIWVTGYLSIQMEVRGEVRNPDGSPISAPPPPPDPWNPSFRYLRLGQATTDLVDAFRNYYLALESLLSAIEPTALRPDGRP